MRTLLASPLRERFTLDVIPTWRWEASARRHLVFPRALPAVALWCLRPGRRLVHVHTAMRGSLYRKAIVVALAKALGRPVVLHLHAGVGDIASFAQGLDPVRRATLGLAFRLADRTISVSGAGAEEVLRRFGARDVVVIPNAAPVVAAAGDAPADGPILYVGGFEDPAKGGAVLVEALSALLTAAPGARADLAGPGEAPPELQALAGREPRVRWLGWLAGDELATAFRGAGVVVLPSLTEGLPVALLEAMAHGRAIVATRAGGMPEVLSHDADALLVGTGDAPALAAALARLGGDPEARARLGAAARVRAQRLNEAEVIAPLGRLYSELLGG